MKSLLIIIFALVISGCGLHSQSEVPAPVKTVHVSAVKQYTPFNKVLRQTLSDRDVKMMRTAKQAPITIEILNEHTDLQEATVSTTGQVRVYQLSHSIDFQINNRTGKMIVPPQHIRASRNFIADNNQVLATEHEKNKLMLAINKDLSKKLIRRLSSQQTLNAISHA